MIDKETISNIFDEVISNHKSFTDKDTGIVEEEKCTVSNRPQFKDAIRESSQKYGLQITFGGRGEETSVSLYDEKNKTTINFSKKFLDSNLIDYKNENTDGKTNLDDVINSYAQLPDKMKKATNLITFSGDEFPSETGEIYGRSSWIDLNNNNFNTVEISPYLFKPSSDNPGLDFVMAHETSHCYDYARIPTGDAKVLQGIFEKNDVDKLTKEEFNVLNKYANKNMNGEKFLHSTNTYSDAQKNNKQMLTEKYGQYQEVPLTNGGTLDVMDIMNSSSDYGFLTGSVAEDYAEASAIIITGHNNPNATIEYVDDPVSYGDWVATHPYQAQYLLRDIYGENYSIGDLQKMGNPNHITVTGIDKYVSSF